MGFLVGYTGVYVPKILVQILSVLAFIINTVSSLFQYIGVPDFVEMDQGWPDHPTCLPEPRPPISAFRIRTILPVIKFEELISQDVDPDALPECCAVCLYEFEGKEEIRWLKNCRHIFHRTCIDRWIDQDQKTCPLCRNLFVSDEMEEEFNQRKWAPFCPQFGPPGIVRS